MKLDKNLLEKFFTKKEIGGEVSVNDLRDKEFSGQRLAPEEKQALNNFDRYRIKILNSSSDEETFHNNYRQLQVIANLGDWKEFLKGDYLKD
ncbi:MAG: hypothetical protein IAF38_09400 [Bacteroidia bacterium]|nr:hypothetical protein [Bacteroidia bacterium]